MKNKRGAELTIGTIIIIILAFWHAQTKGKRAPEFNLGPLRLTGAILIFIFTIGAIVTLGAI